MEAALSDTSTPDDPSSTPDGAVSDGFGGYITLPTQQESFSVFDHVSGGAGPPSLQALQTRYDLLQRDVLAREAKRQHSRLRAKEEEIDKYFKDGSSTVQLLSDDAGVALGKIREIARTTQSSLLDAAVRDLHTSLEEQLTLYYKQSHPTTFEPIRPHAHSALMASAAAARLPSSPSVGASAAAASPSPALALTPAPKHNTASVVPPCARRGKQKILTLDEGLSAATALHAESLAVMLRCEQVRIYILDANRALQLASVYPFSDAATDPIGGDFTTKALSKALFSSVVEKCLAVNGYESRTSTLQGVGAPDSSAASTREGSRRDHGEDELAQIRTCLAWPIVSPSGAYRVLGIIHAINKEGATSEQTRRFTPDDEVTINVVGKTLGCMLERYPSELFSKQVGAQIHQLCHPHGDVIPHLPEKIVSEVDGAQRVANESLRVEPIRVIYRGPMNSIFKTSLRERRAEEFKTTTFGTLSGVEYNLEALKDLWRVGYDENVSMHMQCRILSSKVRDLKTIVKSMVDGLSTGRAIASPQDLRMYLRELELSLRAENAEQITLRIEAAMEAVVKGALPKDQAVIVTSDAVATRLKQRRKENDAAISSIHVDGPDSVRSYTCDPVTKLLQVRAISELMEKHRQVEETAPSQPDQAVPNFAKETFSSQNHGHGKKVYNEDEDKQMIMMHFVHSKADGPTPFRLKPAKPPTPAAGHVSGKKVLSNEDPKNATSR
jgi:hypothetical protein